jgi:FkbM family methyltransferase
MSFDVRSFARTAFRAGLGFNSRVTQRYSRDGSDETTPPPALEGGPYEQIETAIGPFWMLSTDEVMRPYLIRHRAWEEAEADLLASLIKPGARFLDVGANIGYFSVFAARSATGVRVDAIEPHPTLYGLLRANLWANRVRATTWNTALGIDRRFLPLQSAPMNAGDTRVTSPSTGAHYSLAVPVVAADELLAGRAFDVVKIDVQGWEPEVVSGLERIVRSSPGIVLVVEFWPTRLRSRGLDPHEVLDRYRALGYKIAVQDHWGLGHCPVEAAVQECDSAGENGQVNLVLHRA